MQAVILAGGEGTRLHTFSAQAPKPLTPLFNRPVMEYLIELLANADIRDITVTLSNLVLSKDIPGYFGDGTKWGARIRYSVEETPKGTAGSVKELQPVLDDTFLVLAGDLVTDFDLNQVIEYHRRKSAIATIALHEAQDPLEFGIVATSPDGRVTRYLEKPNSDEVFSHTVSAGIYVLEPEVLSSIPYDTPYDFGRELFPRLLRNMEPVFGCSPEGFWCDVGNVSHYRGAHFAALTGRASIEISATQTQEGVWVGGSCDIHSMASLTGPVFLGEGAEIRRNATVGALTVLGERTRVDEGAVLRRSIVGSGAFIGKSSRITDCVIGNGYRVVDRGDVRNRLITDSGERLMHVDWEEDLPSFRMAGEPA